MIPTPGNGPLQSASPNYHDIPLLKKPLWTWEIGVYFFLGGVSAGSYLLARLADRMGGPAYRPVTRAATALAFASVLPCPPLLISDLGDPKRFHHMLRVFKPRSPMSAGTWALLGFSGIVTLTALAEWLREEDGRLPGGALGDAALLVLDAAGLPIALFFSGYTGVLLSATATPVWTKNPWLGPLFTASAIANAAAATTLAIEAPVHPPEQALDALDRIESVAGLAEVATAAGFLAHAGTLAEPLTHGPQAPFFWAAAAGLVAAEVLRHVPAPPPVRRWTRLAGAIAGVASGFCLKWAMQRAGADSASDPEADRQSSRRLTAGTGQLSR